MTASVLASSLGGSGPADTVAQATAFGGAGPGTSKKGLALAIADAQATRAASGILATATANATVVDGNGERHTNCRDSRRDGYRQHTRIAREYRRNHEGSRSGRRLVFAQVGTLDPLPASNFGNNDAFAFGTRRTVIASLPATLSAVFDQPGATVFGSAVLAASCDAAAQH